MHVHCTMYEVTMFQCHVCTMHVGVVDVESHNETDTWSLDYKYKMRQE